MRLTVAAVETDAHGGRGVGGAQAHIDRAVSAAVHTQRKHARVSGLWAASQCVGDVVTDSLQAAQALRVCCNVARTRRW